MADEVQCVVSHRHSVSGTKSGARQHSISGTRFLRDARNEGLASTAPDLFEAIAKQALPRLREFNPQELTNTAWLSATGEFAALDHVEYPLSGLFALRTALIGLRKFRCVEKQVWRLGEPLISDRFFRQEF